jgi:hypothetical protein
MLPTSFILSNYVFDKVFKYGDYAQFWGYVGTNAEPLCVELSNFVQHILVKYLTVCLCFPS